MGNLSLEVLKQRDFTSSRIRGKLSSLTKQREADGQSCETGRASSCRFSRNKDCSTWLKVHVKGMTCALNNWNTDDLTITEEMAQGSTA